MANISTLVDDIYGLLASGEAKIDEEALAAKLKARLARDDRLPCLRMSNFSTPDKQLWFHVNKPELGEAMPPWVRNKLLYGDIIEEYIFELIRQSGHKVEREQEEIEYCGIKGHIDALVDGELLDIKSANSRSFIKFRDHKVATEDPFGYIDQISLYATCLGLKRGSFLAVDKELGHICLDTYDKKEYDYEKEIARKLTMLGSSVPPQHCCDSVPHGSSGNLKLAVRCSYNPYKFACHPGLRAFQYSTGPVFLTRVVKTPDVPEVTHRYRHGTV